jgi:hypothetical protein
MQSEENTISKNTPKKNKNDETPEWGIINNTYKGAGSVDKIFEWHKKNN